MEHPVDTLWNAHAPPCGYPAGVVAVPERINGLGFFPGGHGLWDVEPGASLPHFPRFGLMILGQDFDSVEGYGRSFARGGESTASPTWRNLTGLLDNAGVRKHECFFTNAFMGLREAGSSVGRFVGVNDLVFVAHCRAFLLQQIALQRPKLIVALGMNVPPVLGQMAATLSDWTGTCTIKKLDRSNPLRMSVSFEGLPGFSTTVVALIHPSLRLASVRHRRYQGLEGEVAETRLLRDAVDAANEARFLAKMTDQVQPGEPDAWNKWLAILDSTTPGVR